MSALRPTHAAAVDVDATTANPAVPGKPSTPAAGDRQSLARATVIVPTAMVRREQLQRCVRSLVALDHPDYEVIVVDNRQMGSPLVSLPGVSVVHEPRPGIAAARNRGLREATGEIIAFTDDDVEVDRGWLRALGERFTREPELAAISGLVVPAELETPAQRLFEQSGRRPEHGDRAFTFQLAPHFQVRRRYPGADGGERIHSMYQTGGLGTGSNMAFNATALRSVGGFDQALGTGTPACGGEDLAMLLGLLARGRLVGYEPTAIVCHTHRRTMAELERQLYGYGLGFTAMLTALAVDDTRHLLGLVAVLPTWLRALRDPSSRNNARRTSAYPRRLARAELRGMLAGPVAYAWSRRMQARWSL